MAFAVRNTARIAIGDEAINKISLSGRRLDVHRSIANRVERIAKKSGAKFSRA